ncbi:MAG: creatininase family protein [Defluviitaleaceae bacterium]|nr:creatininase family protein [Defluviitaleaceae bacterium]
MNESVRYAEITPAVFKRRIASAPIAYLPMGTLEWHGEHLPLGSDGLQAAGFFERLAKRIGGVVLPMIFLGPDMTSGPDGIAGNNCRDKDGRVRSGDEFYGMDILGHPEGAPAKLTGSAYWVGDVFFMGLLENILFQLKRAGFKIVVAHGHGPSIHFFNRNRERWENEFGLRLTACYREDESDGLGLQGDHAGANETSCMMNFYPDLVHMENLDPDPDAWPLAVHGQDPRVHASAERGRKSEELILGVYEKKLRGWLDDLTQPE